MLLTIEGKQQRGKENNVMKMVMIIMMMPWIRAAMALMRQTKEETVFEDLVKII